MKIRREMVRKLLSVFLVLAMCLSLLPVVSPGVKAASGTPLALSTRTLSSGTYNLAAGSTTNVSFTIPAGNTVTVYVDGTTSIDNTNGGGSPFSVLGKLALVVNGNLTVKGQNATDGGIGSVISGSSVGGKGGDGGYAGIHVPASATLEITGSGSLIAQGGKAGHGGAITTAAADVVPTAATGGGGGAGAGIGGNGGGGGGGGKLEDNGANDLPGAGGKGPIGAGDGGTGGTATAASASSGVGANNNGGSSYAGNSGAMAGGGGGGGAGGSCGTITIYPAIRVTAIGGAGGKGGYLLGDGNSARDRGGAGGGGYPAAGIGGGGGGAGAGCGSDESTGGGGGGYSGGDAPGASSSYVSEGQNGADKTIEGYTGHGGYGYNSEALGGGAGKAGTCGGGATYGGSGGPGGAGGTVTYYSTLGRVTAQNGATIKGRTSGIGSGAGYYAAGNTSLYNGASNGTATDTPITKAAISAASINTGNNGTYYITNFWGNS